MAKIVVEFFGTFVLMASIVLSVIDPAAAQFAPFAIGLALAAVIYAGAHVSGAHYNPAVTISIRLRGACRTSDLAPFIAAQTIGAIAGGFTALWLKSGAAIAQLQIDLPRALTAEFLFTLILAFVILHVGFSKATKGNSYFGFAIASVVAFGIICAGSVSGAVFNPAVAAGLFAVGILPVSLLLPYIAVQILGAAAAAVLFLITNDEARQMEVAPEVPQPTAYEPKRQASL